MAKAFCTLQSPRSLSLLFAAMRPRCVSRGATTIAAARMSRSFRDPLREWMVVVPRPLREWMMATSPRMDDALGRSVAGPRGARQADVRRERRLPRAHRPVRSTAARRHTTPRWRDDVANRFLLRFRAVAPRGGPQRLRALRRRRCDVNRRGNTTPRDAVLGGGARGSVTTMIVDAVWRYGDVIT